MKTILCYGDSNIHGLKPLSFDLLETSFVPSYHRYPIDRRWTTIMAEEIGEEYRVIEEGLNGRTTVWDDPIEGIHKNGLKYLLPCLESHAPIDLVILMLGTNDLKLRFSVSAFDIAMGIGVLINTIKESGCSRDGNAPDILLLCPPPLGKISYFEGIFNKRSIEVSKNLATSFKKIAHLYNCHYINIGKFISPSNIDGVHYEKREHKKLGEVVSKEIKKIFNLR